MAKKRAEEGSTHFSIRLPNDLLDKVDAIAKAETRTRSNVIQVLVKEALDTREDG